MKHCNRKWTPFLLFWILAAPSFHFAQVESDALFLDPENENSIEFFEFLDDLKRHPLDINTATREQLEAIPFFTPSMARNIFQEKTRGGPFKNLQDFKNRLKVNETWMEWIAPYIQFSRVLELEMDNRMHVVQELPFPEGIHSRKYKGPWYQSTVRMEWNYANRITSGVLIQKDPGEPQWNDHTVGFLQGNLQKTQNTELTLVLGHFAVEAGQGLVLWGPYGWFKGSDPIGCVKKRHRGIKGYISSDESKALQGSAFSFKTRVMEFTGFFSSRHMDARIQPNGSVTGIETSGLHRTESEIKNSNTLQEILFGSRWEWTFSKVHFGMTFWRGKYNRPFVTLDQEKNRFGFQGKTNQIIGIDWDLFLDKFNCFGEIAHSVSKGMAWIVGIMASSEPHEFALLLRHYDPHFQNPKANGFGSSIPENETGGYLGWRFSFGERMDFLFYFDLYQRPWRTYFFPLPTSGTETSAGIQSQWTKKWSTYWGLKIQEREIRNSKNSPPFVVSTKTRYQFEFRVKPTEHIKFRAGIEGTALKYPKFLKKTTLQNEQGLMLFHALQWQIKSKCELGFRWSTFDTDSYETRLYLFEYDFPGAFTLLPCYKKGERFSLQLQWKITRHWTASTKYAVLTHFFVNAWGTGEGRIPQNGEKKWGLQLEWEK